MLLVLLLVSPLLLLLAAPADSRHSLSLSPKFNRRRGKAYRGRRGDGEGGLRNTESPIAAHTHRERERAGMTRPPLNRMIALSAAAAASILEDHLSPPRRLDCALAPRQQRERETPPPPTDPALTHVRDEKVGRGVCVREREMWSSGR